MMNKGVHARHHPGMGDLPVNLNTAPGSQHNNVSRPSRLSSFTQSSLSTQPPITPPSLPPRGSIAGPSTSQINPTPLFLQQQQHHQPAATSSQLGPKMNPVQSPNIVGHALYSQSNRHRSSSASGYSPSYPNNPVSSSGMIGGETTSQNMTSSGYKHQQHMLMQHQQKLHQQQQYQKQHPQRTTSNLPSTQQQQPPSQPQYHPPQPVHTSTPLQQPRLNQVQSSPGDTHNHATHSEDPLHLPQHNPAAAAYFPSNQRNHSIDGYNHSQPPQTRHPRTSSGISGNSAPTRPPPHPNSRPYPGPTTQPPPPHFDHPQFDPGASYNQRGSIATTREEVEMRFMKDQLQSVLAENMRLKSSLEATNVDRDTLQNQLQEVHKAYDDLHKRYQFEQQKLLTLESEAKSLMQTIDAQNLDSVQFQTEKSSLEGENDKLQKFIQELNQKMEEKERQIHILEGDHKQLLQENTDLRKQIARLEKQLQLEKDANASQTSFSPAPSHNGATTSDGSDSLRNRTKLAKRFKVSSLTDLRGFDDTSSILSSVPGSHEKQSAANISYSNQTSSQALHPFNQSTTTSNWSASPQSPEKRQRSSIAHPPRLKILESELDPIIRLETQKSMSAEELNTIDRRVKTMTANQNEARMRFKKNKSKSQSLSKMSMQNKLYSHLNPKAVPHSLSSSSLGTYYEELSLEAQEARSEVQKLYDQPMNKWGIEEVVIFFQHKLHMSEKVVAKAKENIKSGERLLDLIDSDMKKFKEYLGITDELQKIRVINNIKVIHQDEMEVPQEVRMFPQLLKMDYLWVADIFLPHLGLQNLQEKFRDQFIDLLVLITLTEKEIAAICAKTYKWFKMTAKSIIWGLKLLKRFGYDYKDLKRRIKNVEKIDEDLIVWSNQRVIDWVKNIGFEESTAVNLKNTGINGSFLVYSNFSAQEFAKVLELKIKGDSDLRFTHLKDKYDSLVNEQRDKIKREKENEKLSRRHKQAQTYTHEEGARFIRDQENNSNSIRRSLSNSLTRASRVFRKSGSRGSSRASSREASQDRRSVASTTGAMTRESVASSNAVGPFYAAGHSFQSYR